MSDFGDDEQYKTGFLPVSSVRKNGHIVIEERACKVFNINHNGSEYHIAARDIFNEEILETDVSDGSEVQIPTVTQAEFQLVNLDDGYLNLMNQEGSPIDDVKVPEGDLGKQITHDFEEGKDLYVVVIEALGRKGAIGVKEATKGQ